MNRQQRQPQFVQCRFLSPPRYKPVPIEKDVAVGELRVLRGWQHISGPLPLHSTYVSYCWRPGENVAQCFGENRSHPSKPAPAEGCTCGFYGVFQPHNMVPCTVAGIVECWGVVRMGPKGIRAQYARITDLAPSHISAEFTGVPAGLLASLGEQYDATVHASFLALLANAKPLTVPTEYGIISPSPDPLRPPPWPIVMNLGEFG